MSNVVVIGAGVVGLTTALHLARKKHRVTVVAKHHPGDYSPEYTSPWAGANFFPMSTGGSPQAQWETETYSELLRLARDVPSAGIHLQQCNVLTREKDLQGPPSGLFKSMQDSSEPWFTKVVEDYGTIPADEIPPGFDISQCLHLGVVIKRGTLKHIKEAPSLHASGMADVVVNCSGLAAVKLGGVEDKDMVPVRGQTILVRNTAPAMYITSGTDDASDEVCYVMTRAAGRIMHRCLEVCPQLGKLDIISHNVGFRPYRTGGPRLEREVINGINVVHNYGAAGFGYQASVGMAKRATDLVEQFDTVKAKL